MLKGVKGIFKGNLGSDPKERKNGCKFRVATNFKINGDESTTWVDVLVFGKNGENCMKYLSKGDQVFVEGRIDVDQGDENFRSSLVCFADSVDFIRTKGRNSSDD